MISHITISVDDSGKFVLNVGDVLHSLHLQKDEVSRLVGEYMKQLGYFPQGQFELKKEPIPYTELRPYQGQPTGKPPNKKRTTAQKPTT